MTTDSSSTPTIERLEADLETARRHLAGTIDELTRKAAPKAVIRRQVEMLRAKFDEATRTPDGQLRTERVAALAAAGVALVALGVWRRTRH